ncbi:MAG: hypothetical protein JWN70_812 [Planctomycetaceae bacterium]|nr:hypothetical protein [Planctomycetaceae bacterium]
MQALDLLGSHIRPGPLDQFLAARQHGRDAADRLRGERKVDDPQFSRFAEQNVIGLQILVQPAPFVNMSHRRGDLFHESLQPDVDTEQISLHLRFQVRGSEELH